MRFYEINSGSIFIDAIDTRKFKREHLQDTWLFNSTIRDNIAYGKEGAGASEKEIMDAAQAAYADHFIRTLPDGYDTILNEEASNISQSY